MFAIPQTPGDLSLSLAAARHPIVGSGEMERNASLTADGESAPKTRLDR